VCPAQTETTTHFSPARGRGRDIAFRIDRSLTVSQEISRLAMCDHFSGFAVNHESDHSGGSGSGPAIFLYVSTVSGSRGISLIARSCSSGISGAAAPPVSFFMLA